MDNKGRKTAAHHCGYFYEFGLKGSFTVETAYLMLLFAAVFVLCVLGVFYFHDKSILSACAYETAVIGSTMAREKDGVEDGELEAAFLERIRGKCILFSDVDISVDVDEEQVTAAVMARRGKMSASVSHKAKVTEPEEYIREVRKVGF